MTFSQKTTALLVLEDGTIFEGQGFGAETFSIGELCFNTSMTGYQEILTDPSYAGQIITFTFPHIGNTGTNDEDQEAVKPHALGMVVREPVTMPSNWRANNHLHDWMTGHNLPGISGIDTRALTQRIRDLGAPKAALIHDPAQGFMPREILDRIESWPGLNGADLAAQVTCAKPYEWDQTLWQLDTGYGTRQSSDKHFGKHIVAIDYGAKHNILRCLAATGAQVTIVPANTNAKDILDFRPDGVFLSNGPGDPAATGSYAIPVIQALLDKNMPLFGICLEHQILSLAAGAKTQKMHLGHRGANQPVKDLATGKVEITSQNHGFEVIRDSLPSHIEETHISLFDGSNEGIRLKDKPAFSVQYHPEASPGPQDSHYLFARFMDMIEDAA